MKLRIALVALASCVSQIAAIARTPVDVSRLPDYGQIATLSRSGDLLSFRNALGDALLSNWQAARQGQTGSASNESFAAWVDLYQWLDLLESDEGQLTKQWLLHHLRLTESQEQGKGIEYRLLEPGASLNAEGTRSDLLEQFLADQSLANQVLNKLVAQPFTPGTGELSKRLDPEFLSLTLSDPNFLKQWSESFSETDFAPKVLLNLQSIWQSNRADWHEFLSLAIAIAVVMDQEAPANWPHHQVAPDKVPRVSGQPATVFSEWVQAFRKGKLRRDIRQLGVGDLKFVIDAPLESSEFEAVRNNPTIAYQDLDRTFQSIAYDYQRLHQNVLDWPWDSYRLAAIKLHGGICVDQAYFTAITGKALGIPTIFISGQGRDGGHAWVGYLKWANQWDFNVARYTDQNYASGEALDPQSWTQISDHDLNFLSQPPGNLDAVKASRRELIMASDFRRKGDLAGEGKALESALVTYPENPVIWDAKQDWLKRSGASLEEIKSHHTAAIAQFARFNDLKAKHEQALVQIALHSGDKQTAEQLSTQIINENGAGWTHDIRTDLSANAAWSLIKMRLDSNDLTGAVDEFEKQLRQQGERGGGDFVYQTITPFASRLIATNHQDLALKVIKDSDATIRPASDSLIYQELLRLWKMAQGNSASTSSLR